MNVSHDVIPLPSLCGAEGDLLSVRLTVEAFLLEDLLEALAMASFPINPEIRHHAAMDTPQGLRPAVHIELPAWRSQIEELRMLVSSLRFEVHLHVSSMMDEIRV